MKTYIKVSGIIIVILVSLILLKFVHIIVGISFFVIGMGLFVYYGFIKDKDKDKEDVYNNIIEYTKLLNKKCKIPYDLFYINMDKNLDRKYYMEKQLNNIDVKFHRIKGVDGYNIKNMKNDYIDGIKFKNFFNDMLKGEIGCTLSHLKAIKTAYDYNLDIAIICEDDVFFGTCTLSPDIEYIISNAPKDWEIIQLITKPCIQINNDDNKYIKRQKLKNIYNSTACYSINKRGMEKILNYSYNYYKKTFILKNEELTSCGSSDKYIYDIVNTYSYFPNIFSLNNIDYDSTIHTDHTDGHIKNTMIYLNKFGITQKQIKFAKTLIDMNNILQKNKQEYWLSFGTLLGVIREGKFIEHDEDIDIGILIDNYNSNVEKEILKKFKLKHRLGNLKTGYEISFTHPETNVNIDIFIHYIEKDFIWCTSFFGICDNTKNKMCRWKFSLFNLKKIEFLNIKFNIPSNPELYLTEHYGLDWKIPKKFNYTEGLNGEYKNLIYEDFNKEGKKENYNTVWQYWESNSKDKKPIYIEYCMNSVKKGCQEENINYVCLTPENIRNYIPISEIPPNYYKLKDIAHRADFIRALVLYYNGGLWLDADVLRINSIKQLLKDLDNADWVVFGNKKQEFSISVFAVRKLSPLLKEWINLMIKTLNNKIDIKWTEIGYDLLYPLWKIWNKKYGSIWRKKYYIDIDTCYPILWDEWKKFFNIGKCDFLYRTFQPVIVFYNQMFTQEFKNFSYNQFIDFIDNSNTVIADLFKKYM